MKQCPHIEVARRDMTSGCQEHANQQEEKQRPQGTLLHLDTRSSVLSLTIDPSLVRIGVWLEV